MAEFINDHPIITFFIVICFTELFLAIFYKGKD